MRMANCHFAKKSRIYNFTKLERIVFPQNFFGDCAFFKRLKLFCHIRELGLRKYTFIEPGPLCIMAKRIVHAVLITLRL